MIIMIRDAYFSYQLGKMIADSKINYEIFDRSDTLLATTLSSDTLSQGVTEQFSQPQGIFEFDLNGQATIANYISAPDTGWHFVFYTPKTYYYASSNSFYVVALLMLAAVILGMVAIRFLVNRQYSPIRKFLTKVPSQYRDQNEMSQIEGLILDAAQQLRQSKTIQEKHNRQLKDTFWANYSMVPLQTYKALPSKNILLPNCRLRQTW